MYHYCIITYIHFKASSSIKHRQISNAKREITTIDQILIPPIRTTRFFQKSFQANQSILNYQTVKSLLSLIIIDIQRYNTTVQRNINSKIDRNIKI